jgi:hypothetical protein
MIGRYLIKGEISPLIRLRAMAFKSSIEWTDATWNPVRGCTKIKSGLQALLR